MHEAKTNLSKYIAQLKDGNRIILCRRNREIAEIRLIAETAGEPRPIGLGKGCAQVQDSFFESLPDEFLARFEGKLH